VAIGVGMNASLIAVSESCVRVPICTAVVGVGYFGSLHAKSYARLPGSRLVALVDPAPAARDLAEQLGVAWFGCMDELPSTVRAVSVATPVDTHYAITKFFLERGVDVLLEKPIAETVEQAADLRHLAEKRNCILQIGHIERFNPAFSAAADALPRALRIRAQRTSRRPPRPGAMDVVVDLMIHDLDLILSRLDADGVQVNARGCSNGYTVIDDAQAELVFANGCRVELGARWGADGVLAVDRQMIAELSDGEVWTLDFHQRRAWRRSTDGVTVAEIPSRHQHKDELMHQLAAFLDASSTRSAPLVTSEDGHAALDLAHRIRRRILDGVA
jgi:predicted dehydrogenase